MSGPVIAVATTLAAATLVGIGRWTVRAIGRELRRIVEEVVSPSLAEIHERIDRHMDEEEEDLRLLIEVLQQVAGIDADSVRGRLERLKDA